MLLQVGLSKHSVLSDFHPDAGEYFNVRTSLKTVVADLCDRNRRLTRKVICHCVGNESERVEGHIDRPRFW